MKKIFGDKMKSIYKYNCLNLLFVLTIVFSGCLKDNFVEPQNPFVPERLDPNPAVFKFGSGDSAMIIKTNKSNVETTKDGIRVKGAIYSENEKYGDMHLTNGDLYFLNDKVLGKFQSTYSTEHGNLPLSKGSFACYLGDTILNFNNFTGYGLLDFPKVGVLSLIELPSSPIGGAFIFAQGKELKEKEPDYFVPLNSNQYYYLFDLEVGPPIKIGNIGMSGALRFANDPEDPFLFTRCDLQGLSVAGMQKIGFAISVGGLIPFEPKLDYYRLQSFDNGVIYLTGQIPLEPWPLILDGEVTYGFNKADPEAPIKFFKKIPTTYNFGAYGELQLDHAALSPLNISITLGTANIFATLDLTKKGQLVFCGDVTSPSTTPRELVAQVLNEDLEFLDFIKNPVSTKLTMFGSISTDVNDWEYGWRFKQSLDLSTYNMGTLDVGKAEFIVGTQLLFYKGFVGIGPFAGIEIKGELKRTGDFLLQGYGYVDIHGSWGPVSFDIDMELLAKLFKEGSNLGFHGKIRLEVEGCVKIGLIKICVGARIGVSVKLETNGKLEFCFEIGIGKLGYDVCVKYNKTADGKVIETITVREIPLEQVPQENRYEDPNNPMVLPPDFQHEYDKVYTTQKIMDPVVMDKIDK
jgi:hypothetical protein